MIKCSFCVEAFSPSTLPSHLLLCGNKTDECPKCRQFIRRSHFAYHYENNCASIDEIETPPTRPRSQSAQRVSTNSNMPIARIDIPNDEFFKDYSGQNHSINSPRKNDRNQLFIPHFGKYFDLKQKFLI